MTPRAPIRKRLLGAAALALLALSLGACGASNETLSASEGEAIEVGDLEYNVIFSRYLNPADNEDMAYLAGQPPVPTDKLYLGIFVQVQNTSEDSDQTLPIRFSIEDTSGASYESIPSESLFALPLGENLEPEQDLPADDTTAQTGPIEGSMILFAIPETATENRPLELVIPGTESDATVDLDL